MNIPFSPPDITDLEVKYVTESLLSGWITTGPKVKEFEQKLADYCGTPKMVCLNSATACLEGILRLLGIQEGDEVIVPAYTYTATASPVAHVGAKIIIVDTQKDSFEMDYDKMEAAITERTKAVIPVDIGGILCDYDKAFEAVNRKIDLFGPSNPIQKAMGRVAVIADSAHGFGATRNGKYAGTMADFTSFSFHAVKNLTTAEGGGATWRTIDGIDNESIYKEFMLYSLHGQNKDAMAKAQLGAWEYDITSLGYKCNMTNLMAALGLAQLERYPSLLARRREIVERYDANLKDSGIQCMHHYSENCSSSAHLYLVRIPNANEERRNQIITRMAEEGVATNVHYKPLPMMSAYKELGFQISDYPNAFHQYENEISLPIYTTLTNEQVDYICDNLKAIMHEVNA